MWACFCWLRKSWVCCLTLKTRPSCPGLTSMPHSTIGLIVESAKQSLCQWKASCGGHLHFRERTFSKSVTTHANNNHMWCLFLIWWHLTILKWTGATLCTLTMDIMWLLILIIYFLGLMTILLHKKVNGSRSVAFYLMFIKYGMRLYGQLLKRDV